MNPSTNRNWSTVPLLLLLAADLIFVGLQILHALGFAGDPRFSLGAERGYAEIYQYVKLFWTASLLSWFALEIREGLYGVGALLFGYLLLDDALEIHESAGRAIVDVLGIPSALGLRGQDYGEVGVSALAGLVFLGMGWWAYRHSSPRARCMGVFVFVGVLALAGVGVGGDVLHQFAGGRWAWTELPLVILEDGGELVVVSAIRWVVYSAAIHELSSPQIFLRMGRS